MHLSRWEELTRQHIDGIADHVDVDSQVRKARLNRLKDYIDGKLTAIDAEIEAKIADVEAE
jgi:hypothetical protein